MVPPISQCASESGLPCAKVAAGAVPMTAREIAEALMADNAPQATRKQAVDLQAAILVALRNGRMVVGEGAPARWRLKESA